MPRSTFRSRLLTIAVAALTGYLCRDSARAQDASDWDAQAHTSARLIAGAMNKASAQAFVRAGVEINLDPGWKTYWRDPGDSGAPPSFDFSGSENVKAVTVLWPAPQRFSDGAGGNSIGYLDHVILPLHVVPEDAGKGTALKLRLSYDVCGTMCMPVEADLELTLSGNGGAEPVLEKAEVRVPRRLGLGEGNGGQALAVLAVRREPGDAHERVVVDIAAPPAAPVDLFVEGPTAEWSLPLPEPVGSIGATRQFSFDLDGVPPGAHAQGSTVTFTAVSGDDAIEVPVRLD